jgi:2-polyprenyl-3-methyl-5-hydroxy-6-metoxy-1,4-benzoquinol methylase
MMAGEQTDFIFLKGNDALAVTINHKAILLFRLLENFDAASLDIDDHFKDYFIQHHLGRRLYFSIQNSAHIIYEAVKKTGKPASEINIADYGAGLGTLYLLGGMIGFKRMVYNDYLPDWKDTAVAISKALQIKVDGFVTGDIDAVTKFAVAENFLFDIIASRNVIEHIYSLDFFYEELYRHNPIAVIFSTTSANFHNPAMRLKHYLLHKKIEKEQYRPLRIKELQKLWPEITDKQLQQLADLTRGKANEDFTNAIDDYKNNKPLRPVKFLRSNTCICTYGYWCEHLLAKNEYSSIVRKAGYHIDFTAGYWDTHYESGLMNLLAKLLNKIILITGKQGILFSPFVNIIAYSTTANSR